MKQKVFGITGWKNNGKTTMTVRLLEEMKKRGFSVSSIKHAHHDFDIDHENTDSWRHRQAGAKEVGIVSSKRWALVHELEDEDEPTLEEILTNFEPCDLILVEGFKRDNHDKLEVRRQGGKAGEPICKSDPHIVAIASDKQENENIPTFHLDDIPAIADFIEVHMQLKK